MPTRECAKYSRHVVQTLKDQNMLYFMPAKNTAEICNIYSNFPERAKGQLSITYLKAKICHL